MNRNGSTAEACMCPWPHVRNSSGAHGSIGEARVRGALVLLVLVWALGGTGSSACAQSSGQLRFRFEPAQGVSYVLDGKYRMAEVELTLLEGAHRFTFWAPERRMLDTTLTVLPNRLVEVPVTLRYTQAFVDHRRAVERHRRQTLWSRWAPPVVTAGAAAWAAVAWSRFVQADKELDDLGDSYRTLSDPRGIERLKTERIPAAKDDFARARTRAYTATGVFVLSAAATWYLNRTVARRPAPQYIDEERIRFEGLVCVPPTPRPWPAAPAAPWSIGASFTLR